MQLLRLNVRTVVTTRESAWLAVLGYVTEIVNLAAA